MAKELAKRYRDDLDRPTKVLEQGPERSVVAYIEVRNSPLLRDKAFLEARLGVTVVVNAGDYACFLDTAGARPFELPGIGQPVGPSELQRLFSEALEGKLYSVSLQNSNPAPTAVRAKTLTAAPIGDTIPAFEDHAFICRRAVGKSLLSDRTRDGEGLYSHRYVGFGSGRINDGTTQRVSLAEYQAWLSNVVRVLKSAHHRPIATFRRYAAHTPVPADPTPRSVLIEVADLRDRFITVGGMGPTAKEELDIKDACVPVEGGVFVLEANGLKCEVKIGYESERRRYLLESTRLEALYTQVDRAQEPLLDFLNRAQAFQVIPATPQVLYTRGSFYLPRLSVGPDYDDQQTGLLAALRGFNVFGQVESEKGIRAERRKASHWQPRSLFDLVDRLGRPDWESGRFSDRHGLGSYFDTVELLVCDDLHTEFGDFILTRTTPEARKYVVFVHAKAQRGKGSKLSASNLAEVCGQARKSLRELRLFEAPTEVRAAKWDGDWKDGQIGTVRPRVRRGAQTGEDAWNRLRAWVQDPSVEREVWLFLGRTLSKKSLAAGLTRANPPVTAVHAAYELLLTRDAVRSAGAQLLVFCSP